MFVAHMSHKSPPLGYDHFLESLGRQDGAPVEMIPNSLYPFLDELVPFSLLAFSKFLTTDLATCHMSKRCVVFVWLCRIHLAMPQWRSDINTAIATPGLRKKVKQFFAPCNSIA